MSDYKEEKAEENEDCLEWLDRLEESVRSSMNEELHYIQRSKEMRKLLGLND